LGLLALLLATALAFPQRVLCVDSGDVQADAIVVLGGGSGERPTRAAELFQSGAAPRIIVSGAGDAEDGRRILERKGVPATAIQLEPNSKSTRQNAQFSIPLLRAMSARAPAGARRVILVTSWYHSRRALHTFEHYAPDIQFYSRPAYFGYPGAAGSAGHKAINGYIRAEFVKLLGYWVRYGVCPF
jgi:uncharacterized SAM-binding protein YcdF (DUF218 family)